MKSAGNQLSWISYCTLRHVADKLRSLIQTDSHEFKHAGIGIYKLEPSPVCPRLIPVWVRTWLFDGWVCCTLNTSGQPVAAATCRKQEFSTIIKLRSSLWLFDLGVRESERIYGKKYLVWGILIYFFILVIFFNQRMSFIRFLAGSVHSGLVLFIDVFIETHSHFDWNKLH